MGSTLKKYMSMSKLTDLKIGDMGPNGKKIKDMILFADTYIIYIDENDVIQWGTDRYGSFPERFGEIQNKVSDWESRANRIFGKEEAFDIKCLLAEAYARILDDKDVSLARDVIDLASERIRTQGGAILKQYYSVAAVITTAGVLLSIALTKIFKQAFINSFGPEDYGVWMAMLFGGIGAFLFTIVRLKKYQPNILVGKRIHFLDGCLRIVYGVIAGLIIAVAIRSNLVLGFLNKADNTIYVTTFVGVCAGFSEAFVPDLIRQIQTKAEDNN